MRCDREAFNGKPSETCLDPDNDYIEHTFGDWFMRYHTKCCPRTVYGEHCHLDHDIPLEGTMDPKNHDDLSDVVPATEAPTEIPQPPSTVGDRIADALADQDYERPQPYPEGDNTARHMALPHHQSVELSPRDENGWFTISMLTETVDDVAPDALLRLATPMGRELGWLLLAHTMDPATYEVIAAVANNQGLVGALASSGVLDSSGASGIALPLRPTAAGVRNQALATALHHLKEMASGEVYDDNTNSIDAHTRALDAVTRMLGVI